MHYNIIKTAAGARTRLRLPMVWKADAVAAEELPEAVFWVFIGGERVRVEKTPHSEDEYIFPALQAGQYAWDLVVDAQVVLHGVLKVRGSAVPPGGGEVCGTLLVDAPAMVLVLSPGPRGEVGPQGVQGFSAYEVAVQHGYEGSEADWAEELSGAQTAATEAKEQAKTAGNSATEAANSATTASEKATAAGNSAKEAAGSAATASEKATAAGNSAKEAANSATTASEKATAAGNSAKAAADSATTASEKATAAGNSAKAAADSATTASEKATAAGNSAKEAANSATTAGEQATAAANSASAAASSAEGAAASAEAAAQSAETSADAAENVKRDLLPVSLSWLNSLFARELGEENFTLSLSPEEAVLEVAFPYETEQTLRESLLGMCDRVCPAGVQVVESWLPAGWQELEYLKSSGTQYIDTGVVTDGTYTIFARMRITNNSAWGRAQTTKDSALTEGTSWVRYLSGSNAGLNFYYRRQGAVLNVSTDSSPSWDLTETHDWVAVEGREQVTLDGQNVTTRGMNGRSLDASNPGSLSHFVFWASGEYPTGNGKALMQLYRFTMSTADGVPVFDGVPVLNADGEPGILDRVSKRFLSNAGSGTFGYRIKATGEEVAPNASTYSLRGTRDPYYVAPSGVWARPVGEKELELVADTEEVDGEDWLHFDDSAAAEEYFGMIAE